MRADGWSVGTAGLFVLMVFAWGGNYLFVRLGEEYVAPLWLATLRAALGAAAVGGFLLLRPAGSPLSPRDRRDAVLLGVPNTGLFLALWFVAAPSVAPGVTSVVIYTFPLWVALFAPSILGSRLGRWHWSAIGVGFAGVILVSQPWTSAPSPTFYRPLAELLAAAVCWAGATVAFQRRFAPEALPRANAYQLLGGAITLAALSLGFGDAAVPGLDPALWAAILWLSLFGTAFAYGVWFFLLRTVHASTLSGFSFLVPLVALTLSAVFDGETLTLPQALGVVLVLTGIYLVGSHPLSNPRRALLAPDASSPSPGRAGEQPR